MIYNAKKVHIENFSKDDVIEKKSTEEIQSSPNDESLLC